MKTLGAVVVCALLTAAFAATNDSQDEKNVLATLEALSQANVKQDRKALEGLLHENISYGHSNGQVMNKAVAIDYMLGRRTNFLRWEKPVVTVIGSMAMVRAMQVVQLADAKTNKITDSGSNVLWVLAKGPGPHGWQVAARQNFRPEAENKWIEVRDKKGQ